MTPADLQNCLIERIKVALSNTPLPTLYNDSKPFQVFKQEVPEQHSDEIEYDEDGEMVNEDERFPFVCVKLMPGAQEANHEALVQKVGLIIGVHNDDLNRKGFDDAIAAMQVIMNDLNENPIIDDRYPLQYPINWNPHEEDTFPYFFIGIDLNFEMLTMSNLGGLRSGYQIR